MPIIIKKLPNSRGYMVQNALTKVIHAKHTTLKKAEAQKRLLDATDNPCWKGYKQLGMKDKHGIKVPNCVPI